MSSVIILNRGKPNEGARIEKMDRISIISIVVAQIVVVISVLIVFWQRKNTKKLMEKLSNMIDDATKGTLKSRRPDGSVFSELEIKMNEYLKLCIYRNRRAKEKKDRIKSLIAEVAFQTQAPLANVKMYSDMLCEQEDLSEDNKKIATRISAQSERLNVMLESLVKIALLESGLNSIEPKKQNLGDLLYEVSQELLPVAEKRGVSIQYKKKKIQAVFDYPWMMVALSYILENAIKYSEKDAMVKVSIMQHEMYARVDITDNGIGIDYSETDLIFKRFYRGKEAQQKEEGLGIGLYVAKHIIREQCGFIKVSSIVGKGTMFSVFIPRV